MASYLVYGGDRGDGGKAAVVSKLALRCDCRVIVRFGGGANSGHTVVRDGIKYVCNAVPVGGVMGNGFVGVVGPYVVLMPKTHPATGENTRPRIGFSDEVMELRNRGLPVDLVVDGRCHVTLDWYLELEKALEGGAGRVGSTMNGIGWTYAMFHNRFGIRVIDCMNADRLRAALERQREISRLFMDVPDPMDEYDHLAAFGAWLRTNVVVTDATRYVYDRYQEGANIIFEGAQGLGLDVIQGTYPMTTSSFPAMPQTLGWTPPDLIPIMVVKAYETMVGGGILPARITESDIAEEICRRGNEIGARTGRPRIVGWADIVRLCEALWRNGTGRKAQIALTKLDILHGLHSAVCVDYLRDAYNGNAWLAVPNRDLWMMSNADLAHVRPKLIAMPRFDGEFLGARSLDQIPQGALDWIRRFSEIADTKVSLLSTGPGAEEMLIL